MQLLREAVDRLFQRWQRPKEPVVKAAHQVGDSAESTEGSKDEAPADHSQTTPVVCARSATVDGDSRPKLLWAVYYEQMEAIEHRSEGAGAECSGEGGIVGSAPKGMVVCGPPGDVLDLDLAVRDAEHAFQTLFPDEEFFPAPKEMVSAAFKAWSVLIAIFAYRFPFSEPDTCRCACTLIASDLKSETSRNRLMVDPM